LQLPFAISSDRLTYYISDNGGRDGGTVKVANADADAVRRGGEVRRREGKEERRQVRRVGEERKNEEVMRGGKEREEKKRCGVVN
jgi:hypothetical protein